MSRSTGDVDEAQAGRQVGAGTPHATSLAGRHSTPPHYPMALTVHFFPCCVQERTRRETEKPAQQRRSHRAQAGDSAAGAWHPLVTPSPWMGTPTGTLCHCPCR